VRGIKQERFGDAMRKGEGGGAGRTGIVLGGVRPIPRRNTGIFILLFLIMTSYSVSKFITVCVDKRRA
jgi:hypothetical protein